MLAVASGCARVPRGRTVIDEVEIRGARQVDEDDILEKIATEPTSRLLGLFRLPWTDRSLLDRHVVERDILRIVRFYQARGFYDARVESMQIVPDDDEVDVVVRVEEGRPVRVQRLRMVGHEHLPRDTQRALERACKLERGDRFDEDVYQACKDRILGELRHRGYAKAEVAGHALVDTDERRADVLLRVTPGPVHRFGSIRLKGLRKVSETRVRVAMELERRQRFSDEALEDAQGALFGLGVFESVSVDPEVHTTEPVVDVDVEVSEADFQRLRLGLGATADPARTAFHVTTGWEHRNLFGGLQLLRVQDRPGLSVAPSAFNPESTGLDNELEINMSWPGLVERRTTGLHRGEYLAGFDAVAGICRHDIRLSTGLARPLAKWLRATVSHEFERYIPVEGRLFLECPRLDQAVTPFANTTLSYVNETLVIDLRDDPFTTRRGALVTLSFSESPPGVFSETGFLSLFGEVRGYVPIRWVTVAGRLALGRTVPFPSDNDLPTQLRFFAGGANSVRGYTTRAIGAYECSPEEKTCTSSGGDALWEASIELRMRLTTMLRFVVFTDVGDSYLPLLGEHLDLGRHHATVGVGARLDTPVGPLRLDVGYRLPSQLRPEEELDPQAFFGLDIPVTLHLALGEAY